MPYCRNKNQPAHSTILCFEVPADFNEEDIGKRYDTVDLVAHMRDGSKKPWPMNHRVLGERLGKNCIGRVGDWEYCDPPT